METTKEEREFWLASGYMSLTSSMRLCRDVNALEEALQDALPLHQEGGCWFCKLGNVPDADNIHFDKDNVWDGNQRCLQHDRYAKARTILDPD